MTADEVARLLSHLYQCILYPVPINEVIVMVNHILGIGSYIVEAK